MYKQDLEQTLLGIDEEAELEIGPRDDRHRASLPPGPPRGVYSKSCLYIANPTIIHLQ